MAPVSILPGRIRLDVPHLLGRPEECRRLDRRLAALAGVREIAVNSRTGRILVRFDEVAIRREELLLRIDQLLAGVDRKEAEPAVQPGTSGKPAPAKPGLSSQVARHLLLDAVAHTLLPGPLQLLVPAMAAFRR
jgi:hypothetical protein